MERHVQIQTHANSVTGNQIIIIVVWVVKQPGLLRSCFRRQTAINDGALLACRLFDLAPQSVDADYAEGDQAIALLQLFHITVQALFLHPKRGQTLICVNMDLIANKSTQLAHDVDSPCFTAKMYLARLQAEESLCPRPSSLLVVDHLYLINDGDVEPCV
jgi:hypothetical protein